MFNTWWGLLLYFGGFAFLMTIIQGVAAVLGELRIYKILYLHPETGDFLRRGTYEGQPCVYGEIAIGDGELHRKLSKGFALVKVPRKPWPIRLKRVFFPVKEEIPPFPEMHAIWEYE